MSENIKELRQEDVFLYIDKELKKNKSEMSRKIGQKTRNNFLIILLVDIIAIMVACAGFVTVYNIFKAEELNLVGSEKSIKGLEEVMMEEMRKRASADLSKKERELAETQNKLAQLANQMEQVKKDQEKVVAEKLAQMKKEMNAQMQNEMKNKSASEQDAIRQKYEDQLKRESQEVLSQNQRLLEQREKDMQKLEKEKQELLAKSQQSAKEMEKRKIELERATKDLEDKLKNEQKATSKELTDIRLQLEQNKRLLSQKDSELKKLEQELKQLQSKNQASDQEQQKRKAELEKTRLEIEKKNKELEDRYKKEMQTSLKKMDELVRQIEEEKSAKEFEKKVSQKFENAVKDFQEKRYSEVKKTLSEIDSLYRNKPKGVKIAKEREKSDRLFIETIQNNIVLEETIEKNRSEAKKTTPVEIAMKELKEFGDDIESGSYKGSQKDIDERLAKWRRDIPEVVDFIQSYQAYIVANAKPKEGFSIDIKKITKESSPAYKAALKNYKAKFYNESIEGFKEVILNYPNSEYTKSSLEYYARSIQKKAESVKKAVAPNPNNKKAKEVYDSGRDAYAAKRYNNALNYFRLVLTDYPYSKYVKDSLEYIDKIYQTQYSAKKKTPKDSHAKTLYSEFVESERQKDYGKAINSAIQLITRYPESDMTAKASAKLERIIGLYVEQKIEKMPVKMNTAEIARQSIGRVTEVYKRFVEINLTRQSGIDKGTKLKIYRKNRDEFEFIADIEVSQLSAIVKRAKIVDASQKIRVGDMIYLE